MNPALLRPWQDLIGPTVLFVLGASFCFVIGNDVTAFTLVVAAVGAVVLMIVRAVCRRRAGVPPFPGGFWERQYARAHPRALVETELRGGPSPEGREPTLSTLVSPDGSAFQVRLVAPGQFLAGETMFDLEATKDARFTRSIRSAALLVARGCRTGPPYSPHDSETQTLLA